MIVDQEGEPSRLCLLLVAADCSLSESARSAAGRRGRPSFRRRVRATDRELGASAPALRGDVEVETRSSPAPIDAASAGGGEEVGKCSPFTKYVSIRPLPCVCGIALLPMAKIYSYE